LAEDGTDGIDIAPFGAEPVLTLGTVLEVEKELVSGFGRQTTQGQQFQQILGGVLGHLERRERIAGIFS
jgi:hypothetical protein